MSDLTVGNRLDRSVDEASDHILGPAGAAITLVEYGSYACPYCRAANERVAEVRDQLGDRLRYVFRHRPLTGSEIARRAAELIERARSPRQFWDAHVKLMTRSEVLTEDDLRAVASDLGVATEGDTPDEEAIARARARVDADEASARASGALITPTFFINGRRYDGPWDESAFADAMFGTLGHPCARPRSTLRAGDPRRESCCCWRRSSRSSRRTPRWGRSSPRSGNRISDSRSTASAFRCRCCTGSTTDC